jgi:hypothetical protein
MRESLPFGLKQWKVSYAGGYPYFPRILARTRDEAKRTVAKIEGCPVSKLRASHNRRADEDTIYGAQLLGELIRIRFGESIRCRMCAGRGRDVMFPNSFPCARCEGSGWQGPDKPRDYAALILSS